MIRPEIQSAEVTVARTAAGTATASTSWGRYLAKYGIERVEAAGRQRRDLARPLPPEPGRPEVQGVPGQPGPQPFLDRGRAAQRRDLPGLDRDGPADHDGEQGDQACAQGRGSVTGCRAGQDMGEQAGLGQDQAGDDQAEQGRADQVAACRGRLG